MVSSFSFFSPKVEQDLSAWQKLQHRKAHHKDPAVSPTITLARAFGCEGFPLAERLRDHLEHLTGQPWVVYDRFLLELVAHEDGIPLNLLRNLGDPTSDLDAFGLALRPHTTHREAFDHLARRMRTLAEEGNAILVGRGSAVICRHLPNAYHFRLDAELGWRIESLVQRMHVSPKEAEDLVRVNGRHRDRFFSTCLGEDVGDLRFYDAVFNNEHHTLDQIATAIVGYVEERGEVLQARPGA